MPGDIAKISVGRQHGEAMAQTELRQERIDSSFECRRAGICFSIRLRPHGLAGQEPRAATPRTDRGFAHGPAVRRSLAEAPAE